MSILHWKALHYSINMHYTSLLKIKIKMVLGSRLSREGRFLVTQKPIILPRSVSGLHKRGYQAKYLMSFELKLQPHEMCHKAVHGGE